jgi:deoxyribodipyrimidine photolyase
MLDENGHDKIGLYKNGLFVFRRDLRIIDNKGLNLLNVHCKNVFTIFIFTPEQMKINLNLIKPYSL